MAEKEDEKAEDVKDVEKEEAVEEKKDEEKSKQEEPRSRKDLMKKSCGSIKKVLQVCEILLIIIPTIIVIIAAGVCIYYLVRDNDETVAGESYTISYDGIYAEEEADDEEEDSYALDLSNVIVYCVIVIANYVLMIVLINNIKNIMRNIENSGNAFAKGNIKHLNRIAVISLILGLFRIITTAMAYESLNVGLVFILVILVVTYAYKCGCEQYGIEED